MAFAAGNCNISLLFLLTWILLSIAVQVSSNIVPSNRFIAYPKDGHISKNRRDGIGGFHEYEYYNYGYVNCGPRYGYFSGYPYGGIPGYPGYDYHGYGGYPFGFQGPYGAPYY